MPQMLLLLLFLVNSALLSINGVTGLPDINKQGSTIYKHSTNKHNVNSRRSSNTNSILSGGQRTSLVTLTDEFPCEESASSSSSSSAVGVTNNNNHQSAAAPPSSTRVSFTGNSFAEMNNIPMDNSNSSSSYSSTAKSSLTTRGGGGSTDVMDDDEIDQMVEHLISGLDNDQVEEESEEEESDEEEEESDDAVESEEEEESEEETEEVKELEVDGSDESEEDEQIVSVVQDEDEAIEEEEEEQEEESAEEEDSIATKADDTTSVDDSSNSPQQSKPAKTTPSSPIHHSTNNNNNRPPLPLATPTNAYYRFLVRRGPKGHILSALTLISIQWIQVYVPLLYKSAASILLKLHIYDPNVLWKRDRLRREEEDRRRRGIYPQKKGVMGVFSKKDASQKKERNAQQQRADLQASQTLKQLYKAIKSGEGSGGALSEVKYRYLSAAFRRKYGLGKEYRVEKPMSFLGEVLEGDAHQRVLTEDAVVDEVVFSDGEEDGEEVVESADNDDHSTIGQSAAPKQKRKRKKINDWVVQAFGNRNKQPPKPSPQGSSSGKQQYFESALWKTVDNSAIMQAAWESRAAEQLAWQKKKRTKQRGSGGGGGGAKEEDESEEEDEESLVKSSGYGASKMFQSVMTRVGSNGRLPGAYPMDAPPIEECADNRGVVDLARRYGYGDWKESSIYYGEEDSEDEEGSFGGGDLFSVETASQGRKSRRRKKQRSTPVMDATDDNDTAVKRRKRRKKSSSVKLGFSGGGVSWDNSNRVSFEFGVSSSPRASSRRQRNPPAMSPLSNSRRTELNDIKSKLSERSSLFTPDTRVKAPTELLHTSRDRLRKKRSEDES
ncbi:hypothetical protein QTG54_016809 [Skeletonema marinoi]|uniref:Uncharacterized protein n=1 Tax=Skeletonema marinoi TaxID=267567 RepID=A0AAD8XSE2_9STRA|nr:hypothetical protein QTG54_016809 [Skeletonema marinoi]